MRTPTGKVCGASSWRSNSNGTNERATEADSEDAAINWDWQFFGMMMRGGHHTKFV